MSKSEKALDRAANKLYTIPVMKKTMTEPEPIAVTLDAHCQDKHLQDQMLATFTQMTGVVRDVAAERGLFAVIAGGAPRDLFFGLVPNDVDIFVDTSSVDPEDADDALLLFSLDVLQRLNLPVDVRAPDQNRYKHLSSDISGVYNSDHCTFWWLKDETEPEDFEHAVGTILQFIGRKNFHSAEELVSKFDYGLVQTWFELDEEGALCIRTSSEFDKEFSSKVITTRDSNTDYRAQAFIERMEPERWVQWKTQPLFNAKTKKKARMTDYVALAEEFFVDLAPRNN